MHLTCKLYIESAVYGVKELKSYQVNISSSYGFVNKSPSLESHPLERPRLSKPPPPGASYSFHGMLASTVNYNK